MLPVGVSEWSARAPESQPLHVRHVSNLRDARSAAVHHPCVRTPPLQVDHASGNFGTGVRAGVEVFRLVTLVQQDTPVGLVTWQGFRV